VADTKGRPSHDIVRKALQVLCNLEHRGASGSEKSTGDGAGILTQIPHAFLASRCRPTGLELPAPGKYGVGMLFLPPDDRNRHACERILEEAVEEEGQRVLGWRDVPTDNASLGVTARTSQPVIRQVFIARGPQMATEDDFERKLYVIRRLAEKRVSRSVLPGRGHFYVSSLSCRTIVY
jgi:glutamate synthase (ferredoxin)